MLRYLQIVGPIHNILANFGSHQGGSFETRFFWENEQECRRAYDDNTHRINTTYRQARHATAHTGRLT